MDIHGLELEDFNEEEHQQEIRRRNARFKQQIADSKGFFRKGSPMLTVVTLVACLSWLFVGMQIFRSL